jgi:hypothetical protein
MRRAAFAAAAIAATLGIGHPLAAQHEGHVPGGRPRPISGGIGASAIAVATQVDPAIANRRLREGYLTQPMLHGHALALRGTLGIEGMLDFEGATLKRGELAPGAWGEGYVDRRHPHTWLHELVATVATPAYRDVTISVAGGKGFAPFGSDDPMVRPLERFPVNHHLAQILERAVVIGAVRWRPVTFEAGWFNGDEPESPTDAPNASNFADSWARRVTLRPLAGLELQVSDAFVRSPESPTGHGSDHRQRSGSIRIEQATRFGDAYALAEWAGTDVSKGGHLYAHLNTALFEGSLTRGDWRVAARYERSLRPEEERLADAFRTPYPTAEVQILGRTQFDIGTLALSRRWRAFGLDVEPFAELSLVHPHAVAVPAAFVPEAFYGRGHINVLSFGTRLAAGMPHRRAGRYGVAAAPGGH